MLYQIPVGHGSLFDEKGVLDYIVGNWQINKYFHRALRRPLQRYGVPATWQTPHVSWAQYDRAIW